MTIRIRAIKQGIIAKFSIIKTKVYTKLEPAMMNQIYYQSLIKKGVRVQNLGGYIVQDYSEKFNTEENRALNEDQKEQEIEKELFKDLGSQGFQVEKY